MTLAWAFVLDSVPFTKAVRDGETSLGGSESACLGLARALVTRGHDVHVFANQLEPEAAGRDAQGVQWHHLAEFHPMNEFIEWDVVVSLRMHGFFGVQPIMARMRILWSEDLLVPGGMAHGVMSVAWAYDHIAYVSEYHRAQWEDLQPELTGVGWVTKNGYDPHQTVTGVKDPNRLIHISRPERGLSPLLQMWPALRAQKPDAELHLCRYSSMYDQGPGSWSDTCAAYDAQVKAVHEQVGGITYLGELTKPQLYKAISEAAVMWYPGVSTFAETSCIAAIEAQANGTPFVGSLKGALPETARPSYDAGLLIPGVAGDQAYADASIAAVLRLMDGCRRNTFEYRKLVQAGREHVRAYPYGDLAQEWEAQVSRWFRERYESNKLGVLRQLLHEDDHVAAKIVAEVIIDEASLCDVVSESPETVEAYAASAFCDKVIAGKDHDADHYAAAAIQDPLLEAEHSERFKAVIPLFEGKTHVLDVACGNGSFAIALTLANPTIRVHGLDFAQGNIDRAREAAAKVGVAERCTFERVTVYDFDAQGMSAEWNAFLVTRDGETYDGLFVGEFVEHVGRCTHLIDELERPLSEGARVVYTCPQGACAELVPRGVPLRRGHVHRFHADDLKAVFGGKADFGVSYIASGFTERGNSLGNWLIAYETAPDRPAGERPLQDRIVKTRPLQKLSVGMIVKDAENDLGRCLATVYKVADEIVIGDTGSSDATKAIAASYGARVIDLPAIHEHPDGFAGARNAVLQACTGDWFLWIDADEQLMRPYRLRPYLDNAVFNGYVIHQTHVYLDGPPTFDIPQRLFRKRPSVQFYGCVHEQPQDGDANTDIAPALEVMDPLIAHTGYLTPEGREAKRVERNKPLLLRDQQRFPDRLLGKVLLIREAVIESDNSRLRARQLTPRAQQGYAHAIRIYLEHFDDPAHKYASIVRPWYEAALRHLGMGYEVEVSLAGKPCGEGGLGERRAKPERLWVRDAAELERLMAHKVKAAAAVMKPVTFKTDPFVVPAEERRELVS